MIGHKLYQFARVLYLDINKWCTILNKHLDIVHVTTDAIDADEDLLSRTLTITCNNVQIYHGR